MKQFDCADVVPGCGAGFRAPTTEELLAHGRLHAAFDHGRSEADMADVDVAVTAAIRDAA
jgi:predicted small metal-binding protein